MRDMRCRRLIGLLLTGLTAAFSAPDWPVSFQGRPALAIQAPADADDLLRDALQDFWRVSRISTGVSLPVHFGGGDSGDGPSLRLRITQAGVPEGGFRLESSPAGPMLEAATSAGLAHGLYWILEARAGARWFWPGQIGEEVIPGAEFSIPGESVVKAPAYVSRDLFAPGGGSEAGALWERRNRFEEVHAHQHNLGRIFPPVLRRREPELFGVREGRPVVPEGFYWQPDLALPRAADHAAAVVAGWLRLQPERRGVSLSIQDSMRFDEGLGTARWVRPVRWFRGRPDYSDLVFQFANAVAERLPADLLEGRPLGSYAYYWAENTPRFRVHPDVMPVLTADRFQYYDPGFETEDLALIRRWGRSGARRLMLYEYLYGDAYLVPRQAPDAVAAAIRTGHEAGARSYFAECRLFPGLDGPKAWIVGRLLWDPGVDIRSLEREFAVGMFGEAAAEAYLLWLRACEAAWLAQKGAARWLRGYQDETQGMLLSDERTAELDRLLRAFLGIIERQGNPVQMKRAATVERAWSLTRAVVALDRSRRRISAEAHNPGPEAHEAIRAHEQNVENARLLHEDLLLRGELHQREFWLNRTSPVERLRLRLSGWNPNPEAALNDNPRLSGLRAPRGSARTAVDWFGLHIPSVPPEWSVDVRPSEGFQFGATSEASWRIQSADGMWLMQRIPVTPGLRYLASAEARGELSFGVQAGVGLVFLNARGEVLGPPPPGDRLDPEGPVEWTRLVSIGTAPQGSVWAELSFRVLGQPGPSSQDSGDEWVEVREISLHTAAIEGP